MKRIEIPWLKKVLLSAIPMIVVVLVLSASSAQARMPPPAVQMLSTSYAGATISGPEVGFTTVETINFSISDVAKLEVISENVSTSNQFCRVSLDGLVLIQSNMAGVSPSPSADLTVTDTGVASGNHTLTIACELPQVNTSTTNDQGSISLVVTTGL